MSDERAAVHRDHVCQIRSRELPVRDPARELVVPHAVMPAQQLPVLLRQARNHVPARERERPARRLRRVLRRIHSHKPENGDGGCGTHPFHAVTGGDLAELGVVAELRDVGGVSQLGVVRRAAKVELPSGFGESVQTADARGGCAGAHSWAGSGRRGCGLEVTVSVWLPCDLTKMRVSCTYSACETL